MIPLVVSLSALAYRVWYPHPKPATATVAFWNSASGLVTIVLIVVLTTVGVAAPVRAVIRRIPAVEVDDEGVRVWTGYRVKAARWSEVLQITKPATVNVYGVSMLCFSFIFVDGGERSRSLDVKQRMLDDDLSSVHAAVAEVAAKRVPGFRLS